MVDIRCLFTHTLLILQVKNLAGERLFLHKLPDSLNYAFDRVVDHFFPGFDHDVRFGIIGVFFPDIFFQLVFQMFVVAFDKRAVAPADPSLVLLDVMLPGLDGWGVCRAIRAESQTPIIMLTAKSETEDKVNGLKQGADDYITKPFEMKEVLARIEAVLRRSGIEPEKSRRRLEFDKLIIDMDAFELTVDGKKVPTPPKEMELLYHLASTPNRVYTRNQLLDEVWGFDYFGDTRTVDVHIKRLREKLEGVSDQWDLKTVWSVGYKFEVK